MKRDDFKIGNKFWIGENQYLCTDIGKRTVIAIHLRKDHPITTTVKGKVVKTRTIDLSKNEEGWLNGPPYAVVETVLDEYDFPACTKKKQKA